MTKKSRDITPILLANAKKKYMNYESLNSIATSMNVSRSTLTYHVKKEWEVERELSKAELFNQMTTTKKVDFTKMTQSTISIMTKALDALATRINPPTMKEATQAADILATLDKITRLDDGTATDIVSNQDKPITIVEVQKKIANDPFAEEPAGYIELDEEKTNES